MNTFFKQLLLAVIAGILMLVSFPTADLSLLAWVALVPVLYLCEITGYGRLFALAYVSGVIFMYGMLYWLTNVTVIGYVAACAYLSLYLPIFCVLVRYLVRHGVPLLAGAPVVWVALEYLRTFLLTGFPWELLGYSQYASIPLIQIATLTGVYGLSFLVVFFNAACYLSMKRLARARQGKHTILRALVPVLSAAALIFVIMLFGAARVPALPEAYPEETSLTIGVVQPNIMQEEKWAPELKGYILDKYEALSFRLAEQDADIIVWPESALPGYFQYDPQCRRSVNDTVTNTKSALLFGSNHHTNKAGKEEVYYNSAYLLSPERAVLGRYDKLHLVIFGEYVPCKAFFKAVWPSLGTIVPFDGFSPGREFTLLPYRENVDIAALICFEDILPQLVRGFALAGADVLINITNDAWFGATSAPYQHASMAVLRAVENRTAVVRAANTGVSCFIDPWGRIYAAVADEKGKKTFIEGALARPVPLRAGTTFYTRYGDVFVWLCIFVLVVSLLYAIGQRQSTWMKSQIRRPGKQCRNRNPVDNL